MKRYRLIEHTADVGIVACGHNLKEAFTNAACGLFSIMTDLRKVRPAERRIVELEERDIESLLFGWLNQLIFLFDTESFLIRRCEIELLSGKSMKATCYGEKRDPARHEIKIGVKSATYHRLKVDRKNSCVQVIFDI